MVGIEATGGSLHVAPRAQHAAIEIKRHTPQPQPLDLLVDQVSNDLAQRLQRGRRKGLEPGHDRAVGREAVQATKAQEDRISPQKRQVSHSGATYDEQSQHRQNHADEAVVALATDTAHPVTQAGTKIDELEEAPHNLEASVGRDPLAGKRDRKVLRTSANPVLRYPHPCGPPVW